LKLLIFFNIGWSPSSI